MLKHLVESNHSYISSEVFGFAEKFEVPKLQEENSMVPKIDENYVFDPFVTKAILNGFLYRKNVLVQGLHGTGKSTHIEQVASRLNWPVLRVNLDGNLSRSEFIGRDYIVIKNDKQVLEFKEGLLPWSVKRPIALILDEYDAAKPDFLFILQRLLENDRKLVLIDENIVIDPHTDFRIFATSNTLGSGDFLGIYAGTNQLNQAQLDRWHICVNLNYISKEVEKKLILQKVAGIKDIISDEKLDQYLTCFELLRKAFTMGEISFAMSPRTSLSWAENTVIYNNPKDALLVSFVNKLLNDERALVGELFQRALGEELI
ncbi:MAG: AAA family ATPase [Alphaproteobacteria bacterium]|nr:AAA family ATPase [Alphaproteobacteria bacterium]OJV16089.1 MAG: cobaltochelatase subunit CobS [Alphaproteobacteria bacterium 33-17]